MNPLLQPLDLGATRARNRLFFGPHETNLGRGRSISGRHVSYYRRRAAGGAGTVVVEEASVHESDWPYERAPLATACAGGWAAVAAACHGEGALVLAAIGHAGGQGSSAYSQAPLWAPSRVPEVSSREVPKAMEAEDIGAVVAGFATAARLAVEAGLDGVEVNAGQHSLLRQFCSALTNQRQDEWGRDRGLLLRRVLEAVRVAAGPAVVGLRLSLDELAPWAGIVPEAGVALAAEVAAWVDYLAVARGSIYTVAATRPDGHTPPGFNLDLAAMARAALPPRVAVVAQGSIVDPEQAAAAVAGGGADAVEMTRAQIAEPDLGRLLSAGRQDRARPCILCNQACQVRDVRNPLVSCVGEPSAGHEDEDPAVPGQGALVGGEAFVPPGHSERGADRGGVLVVGGGPAGLECARVAALHGLRVRLAERGWGLGGNLRLAARGAGRARLAALADWLEDECRALGVEVALGHEVSAAEAAEALSCGPVVICTGSLPGRPTWETVPGARVVTAAEALAGPEGDRPGEPGPPAPGTPPGPVLVWDPVGGPIGISVAELLAGRGRAVTLATPDLVAGNDLGRSGDLAPANVRLHQAGVRLARRSILRRVEPGLAHLEDRFTGEATEIEASLVVDAGYRLPDDRLWRALDPGPGGGGDPGAPSPARAGDAVAPRSIYEAVLEGRRAALALAGVEVPAGPWR